MNRENSKSVRFRYSTEKIAQNQKTPDIKTRFYSLRRSFMGKESKIKTIENKANDVDRRKKQDRIFI